MVHVKTFFLSFFLFFLSFLNQSDLVENIQTIVNPFGSLSVSRIRSEFFSSIRSIEIQCEKVGISLQ